MYAQLLVLLQLYHSVTDVTDSVRYLLWHAAPGLVSNMVEQLLKAKPDEPVGGIQSSIEATL